MDRHLKTLESLTLMFKGKFLHGAVTPIHVPNLRVLKTTLTIANFVSQWVHLTTFQGPFEDSHWFYEFLSKATNLTSLYATHIGSKGSDSTATTSHALLIHNTLQTLHLNECSISPIFDVLTFPCLEEFAIPTLDDWRPTHPNSCSTSDRDVYAILESQRSSSPIRFLDIGCFKMSPRRLMDIFRECGATLVHARIYLAINVSTDTIPVLAALTIRGNAQTIFPHPAEPEIETNSREDFLFIGHRLEEMLRSRWDVPGGSALKKLRLERDAGSSSRRGDAGLCDLNAIALFAVITG